MNQTSWKLPLSIVLACCSALFSGLTLGLMTLDVTQLKILINAGEAERLLEEGDKQIIQAATYATRVLPVRKNGNLLLVTLLVGNVMVNSAFSILMGSITSGWVGFIVSTVVITIFGEIIPQAACSKYGLIVGYYCTPIVLFIEALLYIVCKPMSMVLNAVIGEDIGTTYSRKQLAVLLEHHQLEANILGEEGKILAGGLLFANKEVQTAMTAMPSVFGLNINSRFTFDTLSSVIEAGFSRIPIFDKNLEQCVVGLVLLKDLLLVDPESEAPLSSLLPMIGRIVYAVDSDAQCLSLLNDFKKGRTHMAVVREVVDCEDRDPYYRHIGVITLEDLLEEILQDEIYDENEGEHPNPLKFETNDSLVVDEVLKAIPDERQYSIKNFHTKLPRQRLFEKSRSSSYLSSNEIKAVTHFLVSTVAPFQKTFLPRSFVERIVSEASLVVENQTTTIFNAKTPPKKAILILQGTVTIEIEKGSQAIAGPWTLLGLEALNNVEYIPPYRCTFETRSSDADYFGSSGKNRRNENEVFRALVISTELYKKVVKIYQEVPKAIIEEPVLEDIPSKRDTENENYISGDAELV
eukprot:GHVP01039956.1.p1 GENE.GHVP01039956.1~~GHVP01039956.1.p1  ORF type:complete len:579 (-),score=95.33 GHVP01039956.1:263-1999(-)